MKRTLILLILLLLITNLKAQGPNTCAVAGALVINGTCTPIAANITAANTASGTLPLPSCGANWKDIWYKFTGTGNMVTVKYTPAAGRDVVMSVYTGACGSLTEIDCGDMNGNSQPEVGIYENTTIGLTYYIRIMRFGGGNMNGTICAWGGIETFGNDCFTAPVISTTNNVIYSSTLSAPVGIAPYDPTTTEFTCNGSIDNLTYFKFTTDAIGGTITASIDELSCWSNLGVQIGLFKPTTPCSSPLNWGNTVFCDVVAANTSSVINWVGLLPNTTYYLIIDGFSGDICSWKITFSGAVLPIELISFTGEPYNDYNLLKWITASETNNDYFVIERSCNAIDFNEVGRINGNGTSTSKLYYTLEDTKPCDGITYYRLIQTDYDGNNTTSNLISVSRMYTGYLKIIKITNLLGQEVSENSDGVLVYYFSDGSVIKKYKIK